MKTKVPRAPAGLSSESRRLWRELHETYDLSDPTALHWLEVALRANDVRLKAEAELARDGVTQPGRDGGVVRHPASLVWKDASMNMERAFRMLSLDIPGGIR